MKAHQIRELTDSELTKSIEDARRERLNLRIRQRTGQLENTISLRFVRRDIARLLTEKTKRSRTGK